MNMTQCPVCHKLCFVKTPSCPSCGQHFRLDELPGKAEAEERALQIKNGMVYLASLAPILAALLFFVFRGYAGAFQA